MRCTAKAIEEQQKALNEWKRAQQDQQQTIESISNKRRGGGLTADQARAAEQQAASIGKRFGKSINTESINRAEALLGGQGLSEEQMADAAFLMDAGKLELDEKASPQALRRAFDRASRRNAADVARFRAREGTQAGEARQEAGKEAFAEGGITIDLEDEVRRVLGPGTPQAEIDRSVALLQKFPNAAAMQRGLNIGGGAAQPFREPYDAASRFLRRKMSAVPESEEGWFISDSEEVSPEDLARVNRFYAANEGRRGRGSVTIINNHNAKILVPGQRAQEAARMNGNTRARAAEW